MKTFKESSTNIVLDIKPIIIDKHKGDANKVSIRNRNAVDCLNSTFVQFISNIIKKNGCLFEAGFLNFEY